jgi:UDP-N-acetylmuramate dehydrogenase
MVYGVRVESSTPLSPLTTLRLGGPAASLVEVTDADETVEAVRAADKAERPVLVLAGGSNVVVSDAGFDGDVVLLRSAGVRTERRGEHVELTVAAGHNWDDLVGQCVAEGLAGIECMSGIPGSAGATPIQNVGAYGQEVAETIRWVTAYDRQADEVVTFAPADCGFGYRHSAFKGHDRHVVLEVTYALRPDRCGSASSPRCSEWRPAARPSSATSGTPCSGCGAARAWCSTRRIRTPAASARSS